MTTSTHDIAVLVRTLATLLRRREYKLATAESCTGGLVAGALTALAGSSAWFDRGWVTYSNAAKSEALGVDSSLIADQGAVSEAVAAAMAGGARATANVDLALAVTGIAGPDGGSRKNPWARSALVGQRPQDCTRRRSTSQATDNLSASNR